MLHIHFSNRFELLQAQLLQRVQRSSAGVFSTQTVIVPSAAMRRALSLALADATGICANVSFPFLAQWLWQQIARAVPGVAETSPFATPQLTWRVFEAFGDSSFVARHDRLAAYLREADEPMRYELASRVAALLEQYLSYRPDWLLAWRDGRAAAMGEGSRRDEPWQAALWQRIDAELGLQSRHPAQAFADLLLRGGQAAAQRTGLPQCVHVFALPSMPEVHMRLLQQLGQWVEVQLYVLNPCREYWFELIDLRRLAHLAASGRAAGHEEGHRLLVAWGKQTQVQVESLVDLCGEGAQDDAVFEPAPGDSLLARLQNSLLELQDLPPGTVTLAPDDRSIELHVCHSLTRELEVLQDHLLGLFARHPGLQPGDILVVTPDLDAAAPLIDALFGTAPRERYIPYALCGRSRSGVNLLARTLLALLALVASRCSASALFDLLQQPLVARRFGLDDAALQQVHAWLLDAGFHWALDARHLASFELPAAARHTLDDALQRLYLGYALPTRTGEPFDGLLGAGDAEGSRAAVLGAFWHYASSLQRLHQRLQQPQSPTQWAATLFGLLDEFMQPVDDELDDLRELQDGIHQLTQDMRDGGLAAPLPLPVLRAALQQQLDDPGRGGVAGGSVNFASMSSLRNLPFAVVCAIGLNDGAFPGAQRPLEFDLMALHPRRGDRQRRSEERGLMLDLLLAARHSLYLSHTGRSVRDNSPLPPSVLVSELLELLLPAISGDAHCAASLALARQRLVVEHPLQPFATACFELDGDVRLRSHDRELAEALRGSLDGPVAASTEAAETPRMQAPHSHHADTGADVSADDDSDDADADADESLAEGEHAAPPDLLQPFFRGPLAAADAPWRQLTLTQLLEFFRNPCRYLLRRRLGIELPRAADELQDDEPFLPDGRARAALARRLLPSLLQGADDAATMRLARAGTEMPAGAIGEVQLQRELRSLSQFAQRLGEAQREPCLPPHVAQLDLAVAGEAWTLQVALADLRPSGLLRWRYGDSRADDYLEAWLLHLALCADPPARAAPHTRWLSADGEFGFSPCANANLQLQALLDLYRRGLNVPLRFYPRAAWQFVQRGRSAALAAWTSALQPGFGEGEDPAYRLALRGVEEPLDGDFEALARTVFAPLREHLVDVRIKT